MARPEILDVNEVVHGIANLLRVTIGDQITLELRLADALWHVRADQGQLEQVLVNLAINSRDAMTSGGVLRIETWNVEGRGGRAPAVRIVVRDTGTGMPADVREHAFEPFFTTKPAGHGTGLGLATVYGTVTSAGGRVTIESEEGVGTQVTVELPAVTDPMPSADAAPKVREALADGNVDGASRDRGPGIPPALGPEAAALRATALFVAHQLVARPAQSHRSGRVSRGSMISSTPNRSAVRNGEAPRSTGPRSPPAAPPGPRPPPAPRR